MRNRRQWVPAASSACGGAGLLAPQPAAAAAVCLSSAYPVDNLQTQSLMAFAMDVREATSDRL